MNPRIDIELDPADALAAAFERAPALTRRHMTAAILEASFLIQREVQERTPTAHGLLRAGISAREPEVLDDRVIGAVGTSLSYAVPVELGTRPHMPPVAPIRDWVETKLGLSGPQAQGVAWAVARKIAREGTEGAFMFRDGFDAAEPQVRRILAAAVQSILDDLEAGDGR
jgi:hypothetical protein